MSIVSWFEKEMTGVEPEILLWAKNFLSGITPVIKQAAEDAVLAAVTVPGTGAVKAAAALATGMADLASKGIPVAEEQMKAAVKIAYDALPTSVTGGAAATAVQTAANTEIDTVGAELAAKAPTL